MRSVVKHGNRFFLVHRTVHGSYIAVDHLAPGEVLGFGTPYEAVVLDPRRELEDRQVFSAEDDEAQEYIDMGTRELLEVLDNRGLL